MKLTAPFVYQVRLSVNGSDVLTEKMTVLRDIWEDTSFHLENLQTNPECVAEERAGMSNRVAPHYKLTFDPNTHTIDEGKPKNACNKSEIYIYSRLIKYRN